MTGLVVFDWNGTLLDDVERATDALNVVLAKAALPTRTVAEFRSQFRLPLDRWLVDTGIPDAHIESAQARWNHEMAEATPKASDGIEDALGQVRKRGFGVGVVSAAALETISRDAAFLGLSDRFDFMHGGEADKEAALREIVRSESGPTFYVGDTEYDMVCAVAAGAIAIGYAAGYRPGSVLAASGARAVIASMSDLPGALDTLGPS